MIEYAKLSTNQKDYIRRTFHSWFNVAEGGKRSGKNTMNIIAWASCIDDHPDKLHLAAGVSISATKLNIIDSNGFGLMHVFAGRCEYKQYEGRDALRIIDKRGQEKIVLITGGSDIGSVPKIKGNTYGSVYITEANKEAAISVPEASSLFAQDGYTNPIAAIGEASTLLTSGQYTRTGLTSNYDLLTTLYRENWIAKRIIDAPCEDMTRAWYSVASQLDESRLDELAKVESRHSVKDEITNALRWARLYGGAAALIVIKGQEDMLAEPVDMDMLMPGCFRGLIVLDRWTGIEPSMDLEEDMDDTDFGYPKYYDVYADATRTKRVRVHHSRILRFVGRELPHDDEVNESYWGASELEHIYEELNKRNATSANIAQLVFQANVRTLKMTDMGEMFALGSQQQRSKVVEAVAQQNRLLSSFGVQVLNATDSYENHPYSFSGISDVYESFMMDMAGAADIPATRLYGRSPQGMNATGESDMKNYYEHIAQLQEKNLRPVLEKLLPIMAMSCWGAVPDDMEIVFEPVQTTTPAERAQIAAQLTTAITGAVSAGIVSPATALKELRENGKDIGMWTKIPDEDIEKAEQEADQGDMPPGADPLGGMPPDPNGGGAPTPQAPGEPQPPANQPGTQPVSAPTQNPPLTPKPEQKSQQNPTQAKLPNDKAVLTDSFEGHEGRKGKVGGSLLREGGSKSGGSDPKSNAPDKPSFSAPSKKETKKLHDKCLSNISSKLRPYAQKMYKESVNNEPEITNDLTSVSSEIGAGMYNLQFRLKSASDSEDGSCRIAEKIAKNMEYGKTYEESTDSISDILRYTQAATPDTMVDNYKKTISTLEKKGYKVSKVKNSWTDPKSIYKGLQCQMVSPKGQRFELQFHTHESLVAKEKQHEWYEEFRKPDTTSERAEELSKMMWDNSSSLTVPKGIETITP